MIIISKVYNNVLKGMEDRVLCEGNVVQVPAQANWVEGTGIVIE